MLASIALAVALVSAGIDVAVAQSPRAYPSRAPASIIEPTLTMILATQATAPALSPVSNVQGAGFNRFVQIWLENVDSSLAAADPNLKHLAAQGILLTNYYAVTHPSEPNYCAVVAGDNFGMDNDDFNAFPSNISTVVDLLDTKGIVWGEYNQNMPYAGFQGFNYSNQQTYANDYVRKHNPLILFDSVTENATRLSLIKNFTSFYSDLAAQTLPQWSFITPNMTNDGHDTTVTFAADWMRSFLDPLLNNTYFMNDTLIVVTFDENEASTVGNRVFALLLGGAIPANLRGTTDNTFYNHYSMLSTVEVNWGLPTLGRWDCGANVLEVVANKTGYVNSAVNTTNLYFNSSYPGAVSDAKFFPVWPVPDTLSQCASGKGVLDSISKAWGKSNGTYNYTNVYNYDAASGNNVGGSPVQAAFVTGSSSSSIAPLGTATGVGSGGTSTGTSTGASISPTSSASLVNIGVVVVLGVSAMVAMLLM